MIYNRRVLCNYNTMVAIASSRFSGKSTIWLPKVSGPAALWLRNKDVEAGPAELFSLEIQKIKDIFLQITGGMKILDIQPGSLLLPVQTNNISDVPKRFLVQDSHLQTISFESPVLLLDHVTQTSMGYIFHGMDAVLRHR
jgi:hypothetical protein